MGASTKYVIMLVLVLVLGLIVYFFGGSSQQASSLEQRTVDSINWEETYDSKSKHPYGTYFIRNIFENGFPSSGITSFTIIEYSLFK